MNFAKILLTAIAMTVSCTTHLCAGEAPKPPHVRFAAVALPFPSGAGADWQQWDSFLTNVVKRFAQDIIGAEQQEQLRDLFMDSRYQLLQVFSAGTLDPVPRLFLDTWNRLSPILKEALSGLPPQTASQYMSFIAAMDSVASLGGLGQSLGLFRVTPDALRGAANLLGTGDTDPLAYVLEVDPALRTFLGFPQSLPSPQLSPRLERGSLPRRHLPGPAKASAALRSWLMPSAFATENGFDRLNQWVPEFDELQGYLSEVRKLLAQTSDGILKKTQLAPEHRPLYRQIVFAAAWQESCWRQFIKKGDKLAPLASPTGDLGMMQVNRNTWRGLYDVKGLAGDIEYNSQAGSEILLYYLNRFAIAKNEDKRPGGHLARATYSAYNGGPGQLSRYRSAKPLRPVKEVDDAFFEKFRTVSSGQELAVKSCYGL